jgi:hypothetical protein
MGRDSRKCARVLLHVYGCPVVECSVWGISPRNVWTAPVPWVLPVRSGLSIYLSCLAWNVYGDVLCTRMEEQPVAHHGYHPLTGLWPRLDLLPSSSRVEGTRHDRVSRWLRSRFRARAGTRFWEGFPLWPQCVCAWSGCREWSLE